MPRKNALEEGRLPERAEEQSRPNPPAKVELIDVSRAFLSDRGRVQAASNVSIRVEDGEFVSIVGPSGCGKSTLLNMIAGLVSPDSGTVLVDGKQVDGNVQADEIGYMFARDGLFPWRTALANVMLSFELREHRPRFRGPKEEWQEKARAYLAMMGLEGFENHYPRELSQGMRQRVALARTLVKGPDLLLMDEPFAAVDAQTKLVLEEEFLSIWERDRKTVILVTHDIGEAVTMSDRVFVMTARPGTIKSTRTVRISREYRSEADLFDPELSELSREIWRDLRPEVSGQ